MLVTSGEHYGAVLNLDFDYVRYLDALAQAGLNLTRTFTGAYIEGEKSLYFAGVDRNTLAPRPGRLIAPWARSDVPGYVNGGNKFNLDRWDDAYFARLIDFVRAASIRVVVVELTFFSNAYSEYTWRHSPLHAASNVNGVGGCRWSEFTTMKDRALVARQEQLVRRIVEAVRGHDNVYFEICNEPEDHRPDVADWIAHMAKVIRAADPEAQHLTAQNSMRRRPAQPEVSIHNFHYTWGRDLIGAIEALPDHQETAPGDATEAERLVVAFDESMGPLLHQTPAQVRVEAWEFLVGGGGIYNGLSWEYTADHPAGAGRGHHAILRQLGILKRFMEGLDLARMAPNQAIVKAAGEHVRTRALVNDREDYVVYIHHGQRHARGTDTTYLLDEQHRRVDLVIDLPSGRFKSWWIDPATFAVREVEPFTHVGGHRRMLSPIHRDDLLLRVTRQG